MAEQPLFERIGGDKLREVLLDFYDQLFADPMIGFLFVGKDKGMLVQREWEFTARFLGAKNIDYSGRPMRKAHAASPILGGHFARRLQILKDTLAAHSVDEQVATAWIDHTEKLRDQVTADASTECNHNANTPDDM